jgi:hypothetical protein
MLLFTFRSTRLAIARRLSCNTPRCYFSAKGTCYDSKGGLWLVFPQRDVELSLPWLSISKDPSTASAIS